MAKKQTPTVQDYHKSETYKNADTETAAICTAINPS